MSINSQNMDTLISMCERYGITRYDLITGTMKHLTPEELSKSGLGKSEGDEPTPDIVMARIIQHMLLRGYFTRDGVPGLIVDLFVKLDIPLGRVVKTLSALCLENIEKAESVVGPRNGDYNNLTQQENETDAHFSLRKALFAIGNDLAYEHIAGMVLETATLKQMTDGKKREAE